MGWLTVIAKAVLAGIDPACLGHRHPGEVLTPST